MCRLEMLIVLWDKLDRFLILSYALVKLISVLLQEDCLLTE